ncbi:hypothetical protein [Lactococcus fujiensis]|uniref:hypothetical protein n=1 Tax=Lactococcus fujiensis TaxID=610251 RepID=UPI000A6F8405|nr:hypothetical protein [Lactococcus fujiensis]
MKEPNGYLLHGTTFSSKDAAFELLVHNREQELRFHEIWDEDAQPYYFETPYRLTIPKSVADELDSDFSDIDATDIGYVLDQTGPYGSRAFVNYYFKNKNIIALYLAGKASELI